MDTATQLTPGETTATPPDEPPPRGLFGRVTAWRKRHKMLETVLFFAGGFCFDLLLLERIDSRPMLIHQGSYLALLSILLAVDHHFTVVGHEAKGFWGKVLHFRHEFIHFLFGTLLNAFLVFYFKASSGIFALLFMVALLGVLLANEMPRFRKLGPLMRVALHSFALTSFFSYLFPVIAGFLSAWLFVLAVVLSSALTYGMWKLYARWTHDPGWTFKRAVAPALAIQALLLGLYFLHVVPPVPLSLKWIGIYHDVQRDGRETKLMHQRPVWRFWEHGDQVFKARPGDRIHCFVRIFAPRNFKDAVKVRWAWFNPKGGWTGTDAIPLPISGGQEEGWRGVAWKQNYTPGKWRVNVETADGRDIGNIRFTVVEDQSTEPREFFEDHE
ncbi:MAG: DUF2914 domain-containing protein [Myxococcaceae bacterium]